MEFQHAIPKERIHSWRQSTFAVEFFLGYLTMTEDGEKIIDNGLILKDLNEADLGIITDQAGVLRFDRIKKDSHHSLGAQREAFPCPCTVPSIINRLFIRQCFGLSKQSAVCGAE